MIEKCAEDKYKYVNNRVKKNTNVKASIWQSKSRKMKN